MTIKKLKSIDIINVLSNLVSEKLETTVKLPEEAGVGVVMGNGSIHAKAVANYVTEDKDSNGIGVFIEKFI